ncbi:MAG TPA: Lrp/AsnC family transcriptional regulator [Solirubrobacterales bacterium]|nr:Lrp/AsnC family transcriptional regulator [Solirubrobacterales bacterium]
MDREILACLREDGRMQNAEIARRVGIAQNTVQRRLDRLKDRAGLRVVPVIEPDGVDLNDCIYVGVKTERRRMHEVAEKIKAMPEVRYLALTTGPWDLLVEAFVGSRHHMAEFLLGSVGELDGVADTETFSVLRIAKFGYEWEVPEYDDGWPVAGESNAHPADRVEKGARGEGR